MFLHQRPFHLDAPRRRIARSARRALVPNLSVSHADLDEASHSVPAAFARSFWGISWRGWNAAEYGSPPMRHKFESAHRIPHTLATDAEMIRDLDGRPATFKALLQLIAGNLRLIGPAEWDVSDPTVDCRLR